MMSKFVVWILAFSFFQPVFARTAVLAPGANAVEFYGWLTTQSGVKAASADFALSNQEKETFNKLLASAQKSFLSGSLPQAREGFASFVELAFEQDWRLVQRRALHYGFLRLAQMSITSEERSSWLKKACAYGADIKPDSTVFPPPLMNEYRELLKSSSNVELKLDSRFDGYTAIVVDGKVVNVSSNDFVSISHGQHRLTLRSDTYAEETLIADAQVLANYSPKRKALARGSCETPEADSLNDAIIFYDKECQVKATKGKLERVGTQNSSAQTWKDFSVSKPTELSFAEAPRPKRPLLKSPWLWAGLAVVASAIIITREQQSETTVTPSSRVGY